MVEWSAFILTLICALKSRSQKTQKILFTVACSLLAFYYLFDFYDCVIDILKNQYWDTMFMNIFMYLALTVAFILSTYYG